MRRQRIDRRLAAVVAFLAPTWFVAVGETIAAPHKLKCSVTIRVDARDQRPATHLVTFIYDDRERTLFYADDSGSLEKCINSAVGSLEIMGACGSASVWINRSTYQFELNRFEYRWDSLRKVREETWLYGEKGSCEEIDAKSP